MLPAPENDQTATLIELSRQRFASQKAEVEEEIRRWAGDELFGDDKVAVPVGNNHPSPQVANQKLRDEQKPNILTNLKNPEHKSTGRRDDRRDQRPVKATEFKSEKPKNDDQILDVKTDILTHQVDASVLQAGEEVRLRQQ